MKTYHTGKTHKNVSYTGYLTDFENGVMSEQFFKSEETGMRLIREIDFKSSNLGTASRDMYIRCALSSLIAEEERTKNI